MELGQRIRNIRKQKKMTLVELSKTTGVAQASLSRIETGIMNGTIESHRKIASALSMSLAELYSGIDTKLQEISHFTTEDIKQEAVVKNDDIRLELLTSQIGMRKFAPVLITLPPHKSLSFDKLERDTDKFLWIQEGSIAISLNNKEYVLKTNETIYFDASFSHVIKNNGNAAASVLSVTAPSQI